jgi:excisionase family DNA binding protein
MTSHVNFNLTELAEKLRVSYVTALRIVKAGKIKSVKVGREYRVTLESLEAFLRGEK